MVIVLIATALQTARNAGQKRLAEKLSAASATWVRFVFGLPIAAIYCLALWNAHAPHIVPWSQNDHTFASETLLLAFGRNR